jgi:hypothetical protein
LTPLAGYSFNIDDRNTYQIIESSAHIIYISSFDRKLHELYQDASNDWNDKLIAAAKPPLISDDGKTITPLAAYSFVVYEFFGEFVPNVPLGKLLEGSQHIVYISADGHLHELWLSRPGTNDWVDDDLTLNCSASPSISPLTALAGYTFVVYDGSGYPAESTQHIVYIGTEGYLHEMYLSRPGGAPDWQDRTLSWVPKPAPNSKIAAYSFVAYGSDTSIVESSQHIIYVGDDYDLHELYMVRPGVGDWAEVNISNAIDVRPSTTPMTPLVGYSHVVNDLKNRSLLECTQQVFFISKGGDIYEAVMERPGIQGWRPRSLFGVAPNPIYIGPELFGGLPPYSTDLAGYSLLAPPLVLEGFQYVEHTKHVLYIGGDEPNLYELYIDQPGSTQWDGKNVTQDAQTTAPQSGP